MPHTLLLADDSVTIQRVIELTFADEDVQVVAVSDGDQAVERIEAAPPDIVLADVGMPGRNGYEVARYVRQSPRLAHIPVVLLTGAFEPVDQAKATEVGCDGVLAKPFEPQLVIARVKELLEGPARRKSQPPYAPEHAPAVTTDAAPHAAPAAEEPDTLGDYFDRLDTAFAKLAGQAPAAERAPAPPTFEPPNVADQIDRLAAQPPAPAGEPAVDFPLSYASPQSSFQAPSDAATPADPAPSPDAAVPAAWQPAPTASATTASMPDASVPTPPASAPTSERQVPTIADAFAAILDAEQRDAAPSSRPVWPTLAPAAPPAPPEISGDLIDRIVQRVVAQLSDRVVRERVNEIAERLIREEIDRIKAAIK